VGPVAVAGYDERKGALSMRNVPPVSERVPCPVCGFAVGDRVEMLSGLLPPRMVHGVVVQWQAQCGHIIEWDGSPYTGTALPNPNVRLEKDPK
jgi:hypothetical protein